MQAFFIALTIFITFSANIYYIVTIFRGQTKPHIYSWLLWFIVSCIVLTIQVQNWAWWWALSLGLGLLINACVTVLSLKYGEKHITKLDTISFFITLCIIPIWLWAKMELLAVLLASLIDMISFFPTVRKSFTSPREENLLPYIASMITYALAIALVGEMNIINVYYPAFISVLNIFFISYILWRRKIIKK